MQNAGMMGLLNDPSMAGLLGAAGGLLSASGPTPQKVGLGGAMGSALGGGMAGMIGAEQYRADREMQNLMKKFMEQQMGLPSAEPQPGITPAPMPQMPSPLPAGVTPAQMPSPATGMPGVTPPPMPSPGGMGQLPPGMLQALMQRLGGGQPGMPMPLTGALR